MITLLRKGELRAPNGDPELQRVLDTYVPFEYITGWLRDHEGLVGVENRVTAIQSGTASGKSITIPSETYLSLVRPRYATGGGVICTQPRVLTAVDNARKIASIPKYAAHLKIGETIGWSTQYFKERPVRIGLLFATIGVLAMQLQLSSDEEIMNMYRYIIIDEVHERSLQADLTLAALKNFVHRNARNPRCPFIILMSATFDPFKVARYFLVPARSTFPDDQAHARALEAATIDALTPNVIICNALPSHPREKRWPSSPIANIIDEVVRIVLDIMDTTPAPRESWDPTAPTTAPPMQERDDILVFMPGEKEIKPLHIALKAANSARNRAGKTTAEIVVLNRQTITGNRRDYRDLDVPLREVNKVHERAHERRVIISTTVAETGKTFNSLRYVIDSGFSREIQYNPSIKAEVLLSIPAQVSRVEQRWGRVGRLFPGVVYPLYTLETYKKLPESQLPEILTTDITPIILQLVYEQQKTKFIAKDPAPYFRIQDMDLVDSPSPDALLDALERARTLGFIAHNPPKFTPELADFLESRAPSELNFIGITRMGRIALELSMLFGNLENMRMVLAGFQWNYKPAELIMIAARGALEPIITDLSTRTKIQYSQVYRELLSGNPQHADIRDPAQAWHMILSDTFFDAIAIGTTIDRLFASGAGGMQVVREWARRVSLDLESVLRFIELRDNMSSALIRLGFNVHGGASIADMITSQFPADSEDLARAILSYKRCIYDGFRLNHVKWSAKNSQYMTDTGLHVAAGYIEKLFAIDASAQVMPASIVFDKYTGKADRETGAYDIISMGGVSILDGFIGHDRVFSQ
jgi:hypothetical protein